MSFLFTSSFVEPRSIPRFTMPPGLAKLLVTGNRENGHGGSF
jgi:hypothetical protein